ncbi:ferredoxin [Streptomyces sp. NPDC056796]|uniref:ferredoxin n=1 Tax=Streptomyces sp. NPDC056796 TaxID=3345947 RepID=UPI0036BFF816
MAPRPDNRLLDAPMVPVSCEACGAQVEARKSSWEQTSIQWHAEGLRTCAERRDASRAERPAPFTGCRSLTTAIGQAALRGRIRVQSEEADATDRPADGL